MTTNSPKRRARALLWTAAAVGGSLLAVPAVAGARTGSEPSTGSVFAMSNGRDGNVVVAYDRQIDGTLDEAGRYDTGGTGSGSFEDTANGLVLTTAMGEISPNNLVEPDRDDRQVLLATNAGSNSISVFGVEEDGLELLAVEDSNGEKPVSITVHDSLVYVLHSGETNDSLFDDAGEVIPNCTTGGLPSVTGFRLGDDGGLTPIAGSERSLSGEATSGCAQVSFDPTGRVLVVTERLAQPGSLGQQTNDDERLDDEGVIVTFAVADSGELGQPQVSDATGQGAFGFTFSKDGNLLATEQFDGLDGPGRGAAASYVPQADGTLLRSSPSIQNGGTDTCWFVATDDGHLGFTTSFFGDGRISSYALDDVGLVSLLDPVATGDDSADDGVETGASDLALSGDSGYLYQLNSVNGTISAFANHGDGTLSLVDQETPFPQPMFGPGGGEAAPLGLAAR